MLTNNTNNTNIKTQRTLFSIIDLHPGRGHRRDIVKQWYEDIEVTETDSSWQVAAAGKRYREVYKEWNGNLFSSKARYHVEFFFV